MASVLPLRVSTGLYPYDRWSGVDAILDGASHADKLGFYAVGLPEHVIWPVTDAAPLSVVWYDNFVLAAAIATATTRLRVLFNACVVPYRHPLQLAKSIATLDVVARGRVVLVAGTGWMRREFRALGIPFDERGDRTDDALRAMKALWTEATPSHDGRHYPFPPMHFMPKCVQQPHVPVWIGGTGPRAFRRAAELGDGWSPMGGSIDEVEQSIKQLVTRLEAVGRDASAFTFGFVLPFGEADAASQEAVRHVSGNDDASVEPRPTSVNETVDLIGECLAAGVNHFVLQFAWRDPQHFKDTLDRFASDVMTQFAIIDATRGRG